MFYIEIVFISRTVFVGDIKIVFSGGVVIRTPLLLLLLRSNCYALYARAVSINL